MRFELRETRPLGLHEPRHGNSGPLCHDRSDVVGLDLFFEVAFVRLKLREALRRSFDTLLGTRNLSIVDLRGTVQISRASRALGLDP